MSTGDSRPSPISAVNDFVVKFANVNGTGSASANNMFSKALFRLGIPIVPKNIFPSNIQGLPTWYEVRVSVNGWLGRRGGVDMMVAVNPQSLAGDAGEVESGGYILYDSTKPLPTAMMREDVNYLGIPLMQMCVDTFVDARQRQLFKNMVYVGALAAFLDMGLDVYRNILAVQFKGKEKLIAPNIQALELGYRYALAHFDCPIGLQVRPVNLVADKILMEGNAALALGAIYGGATVAAWYPITPSTSVVDAFRKYARQFRTDAEGRGNYAVVQAEDELAAMGMVIGASWNGARAFTATSGPGISLMSEFLGLAYFAEVPAVLFDIQRAGPSTGMPTRTQQSDILSAAYASHGDTRHPLLFPSSPRECFDFGALAFDLADRLQTPILVMSDLDLGMNDNISEPLSWDDGYRYDRGKVLNAGDLEAMEERYGRYRDVDGDGICYRTVPGTHAEKGAFFTRGTSRDRYAVYTELGEPYADNMERLLVKWETAKALMPASEMMQGDGAAAIGAICYGTTSQSMQEASQMLQDDSCHLDVLRVRAFPFGSEIKDFIAGHDRVFVVEQNRDAQLLKLLVAELGAAHDRLVPVLHFNGTPITARFIYAQIIGYLQSRKSVSELTSPVVAG